jgi:hypothetical protein
MTEPNTTNHSKELEPTHKWWIRNVIAFGTLLLIVLFASGYTYLLSGDNTTTHKVASNVFIIDSLTAFLFIMAGITGLLDPDKKSS